MHDYAQWIGKVNPLISLLVYFSMENSSVKIGTQDYQPPKEVLSLLVKPAFTIQPCHDY